MTAEVALLNKSAIALAADSATTVTYWEKNEPQTRYFKGANKVFNISKKQPIGVMTFASANLQGVPWEIIIKAYREHLGSKALEHLTAYAADFFEFIKDNNRIFPEDVQETQFFALTDRAAAILLFPVSTSNEFKAADEALRANMIASALDARENALSEVPLIPGSTRQEIDSAQAKFGAAVATQFRQDDFYNKFVPDAKMDQVAKIAIEGVYRSDLPGRDGTGLAFAGYGDREYFPRLEQYLCIGLVLGKPYFVKENEITISHNNSAEMLPLAKSEMINTFALGASIHSMTAVHAIFVKRLDELEQHLKDRKLLDTNANIHALKSEVEDEFRNEVVEYYYAKHQRPLRRVIANLPINELAELAETLVYIESLKERVTTPEETVSGAIDVAVISKHDGFIWIKRKHYFKPELNHRFFVKQRQG